jgi:hypothetical protein
MPRYKGTHQTGKTNIKKDKKIQALKPGKRKALKSEKPYYEYRRNRSDVKKFL